MKNFYEFHTFRQYIRSIYCSNLNSPDFGTCISTDTRIVVHFSHLISNRHQSGIGVEQRLHPSVVTLICHLANLNVRNRHLP